ncbi:MAG: hypothetical protein JWO38_1209 [Gemmataceae bacterium]|nr:hypothetical protein [Gemmataceae bacterium]
MPPEWLVQQFPVTAAVLITAWLVVKWTEKRHERELARQETQAGKDGEWYQATIVEQRNQMQGLIDQLRLLSSGLTSVTDEIVKLTESQQQTLSEFQVQLQRLGEEHTKLLKEKDTQINRLVRQLNQAMKREEGKE